ncbi:MAG: tRNA-dihydrouridine synthase family protein [Gemmataceae bacterium]|nr:tRNA-dihydrouridine synthase family protein [Gemmataceae bacterium]
MEGVADVAMRALLSELGGFTFCVAEFLRISQAAPGVRVFQRHVPELLQGGRTATGLPVQVQLLGGDPGKLAQAARAAIRAGALAVDLNFGCPARTVNRHDGGATLLQYPDRIRAIVAAVRAAVPAHLPVSAKLRLGWDNIDAIHVNAERAAEGGADWITIHARTKSQGYRPPAYWKPLAEVRARLRIPVVANGEIWTSADLRRCRDETGCQHFMLGRGALADPTLGRKAARELGLPGAGLPQPFARTPAEWLPLLSRYGELCRAAEMPPAYILCRVKQWLRMNNHDGKQVWFDNLKGCRDLGELLRCLDGLAADFPPSPGELCFGHSDAAGEPAA